MFELVVTCWEPEEPGIADDFGHWEPFLFLEAAPESLLMKWPDFGRNIRVWLVDPETDYDGTIPF